MKNKRLHKNDWEKITFCYLEKETGKPKRKSFLEIFLPKELTLTIILKRMKLKLFWIRVSQSN